MKNPRDILKKPVITEKSTGLIAGNKYTFLVSTDVNKMEIKQAVENLFKVKVKKVSTMMVKGKMKRARDFFGRPVGGNVFGRSADVKKAIVTLREGDRIEIMEGL